MPDDDHPPPSPTPSPTAEALCRAVEESFEREQVPWLAALVEQPSHTHAREDVEAAARILDEAAERIGLTCTKVPDSSGRFADHRLYATPATGPTTRSMALVGHIDTVFPRSMNFLAFTRDGDVIRGPGVLDMKSGLSAIVFALRALREVVGDDYGGLRMRFVCVSDEEVGSPTSQALFEQLAPHLSEALVFEAGRKRDQIVTRRKGGGVFTLTVHGRAAHAGADHASGVNAIHGLARLIPRIEALTDPGRGVTLNVGLIEGGTAKNTVPDRAQCVIDARFCTREDADAVGEELQRIATDPFGDDPGVPERLRAIRVELGGGVTRPPMEADAASTALRTRYEACASAVGLETGEAPLQGGGSDANLLSAAGVPSIDGLGPYGELFHNPGEWSSLSSLERRTKALALYLERSLER